LAYFATLTNTQHPTMACNHAHKHAQAHIQVYIYLQLCMMQPPWIQMHWSNTSQPGMLCMMKLQSPSTSQKHTARLYVCVYVFMYETALPVYLPSTHYVCTYIYIYIYIYIYMYAYAYQIYWNECVSMCCGCICCRAL
jgi:hypothetical protein